MATAVHPPQVRRNPLSNALACAASMQSRGICVHVHCRHGLRLLSGCSASPLSNIRSGGCRGVDSSSVASASLSPQRRTRLSLAAAPRLLLWARLLRLRLPPFAVAPSSSLPRPRHPRDFSYSRVGERPASPLSARRPALHPRALPVRRARLCALLGLSGGTPSAYDSVSLAVALSAPRPTRLSPPLSCGERAAPSLSARRSPPQRSRAAVFARCLGVWRDTLLPTITSYLSLAAGPSPLSRDR